MGIAIHNLSASGAISEPLDLAAGVRQDASGIFGTTAKPADLVIIYHSLNTIFDSRNGGCGRRILIHQFTLRVEAGGAEGFEDEVGNAEGAEE